MVDELARSHGSYCVNAATVRLIPAAGPKGTVLGRNGEHDAAP